MLRQWLSHGTRPLVTAIIPLAIACTDATDPSATPPAFTADISGTVEATIRGGARLFPGSIAPIVVTITSPTGQDVTALLLDDERGEYTISVGFHGSPPTPGTYAVMTGIPSQGASAGPFVTGGFLRRRTDGSLQVFPMSGGTVTIDAVDSAVRGTFTLRADSYDVLPASPRATGPTVVTPIEHGVADLTISGRFVATWR
jgi:hypothetical protein